MSKKLYHSRRFEEDPKTILEPTKAEGQWRNGRFGQFLYATPRWDQAVLYAMPFPNAIHSFITTLDGNDPEETLARFDARDGQAARSANFLHRVYAVDREGFEPVASNPREWISDQPKAAEVVGEVRGLVDVLSAGVQYFTVAPGADPEGFERFAQASQAGNCSRADIAREIADPKGGLAWENELAGLGLDPKLEKAVARARMDRVQKLLGRKIPSEMIEILAQAGRTSPVGEQTVVEAVMSCSEWARANAGKPSTFSEVSAADARCALAAAEAISALYGPETLSDQSVEKRFAKRQPTCAMIVRSPQGKWLFGRVTGRGRWDLPKGGLDDGEEPMAAAIRELREETGIDLSAEHRKTRVGELGAVPYAYNQDLHVFWYDDAIGEIDIEKLKCASMVEPPGGASFPEVDAFEWREPLAKAESLGSALATAVRDHVAPFMESVEFGYAGVFEKSARLEAVRERRAAMATWRQPEPSAEQKALMEAVVAGDIGAARESLSRLPDAKYVVDGRTPLMAAAKEGNAAMCKLLLPASDARCAELAHGQTALIMAAAAGHPDIVRLLIPASNVDHNDNRSMTALRCAAASGCARSVSMLSKAAKWPAYDGLSTTPLMAAAEFGHASCVGLLANEKTARERDYFERDALMWAAEGGHAEAARALFADSDSTARDWLGRSAVDLAKEKGHGNLAEEIQEWMGARKLAMGFVGVEDGAIKSLRKLGERKLLDGQYPPAQGVSIHTGDKGLR